MARRVFFSFHYERDVWRVGPVRNSWVTKPDREAAGFWDAAAWEEVQKKSEDAVMRWIDKQLEGASVTAALIGAETSERKYVQYEIKKSWEEGKGLFGIYIHKLKDRNGNIDRQGNCPFDNLTFKRNGNVVNIPVYDWVTHDGYNNLANWVDKAAKEAGR